MTTDKLSKKDQFLRQTEDLFFQIQQWLADTDLTFSAIQISIEEEECGLYIAFLTQDDIAIKWIF